jgi:hypothetical protein
MARIDPQTPAAWWSAALLIIACGENADAGSAGRHAWRDDVPPGAAVTVQFVLGLACFELGRLDEADAHPARAERPGNALTGQSTRGVFSFTASATVMRGCVAALRGDHAGAAVLIHKARSAPDQSLVESVTIEFWAVWCAVQEGIPSRVDELAQICIKHAVGLGDSIYATTCRLFRGWSPAMRGQPDGLALVDEAYADYTSRFVGLRHQNTVQLALGGRRRTPTTSSRPVLEN